MLPAGCQVEFIPASDHFQTRLVYILPSFIFAENLISSRTQDLITYQGKQVRVLVDWDPESPSVGNQQG